MGDSMNKKIEKNIDLMIIGAGPAGLTATIYAARAKLNFITLENGIIGGQIKDSYVVENYPGFTTISGEELVNKMTEQCENAGGSIDEFDEIASVKLTNDEKIIETKKYIYKPLAVIIATGAKHRELPIKEEKKFHGRGIHYCELCDGALYQDKDIIVVGGGNSALQAAKYLSKYGKSITLVHMLDYFQADKQNQDELKKIKGIKIILNSIIQGVNGKDKIEEAIIKNVKSSDISTIKTDGIFVYIGLEPNTDLFKEQIKLNKSGYIITDEEARTNVKGVYAAGDVREKNIRQLTTAVSDGSVAALYAEKYINKIKSDKER